MPAERAQPPQERALLPVPQLVPLSGQLWASKGPDEPQEEARRAVPLPATQAVIEPAASLAKPGVEPAAPTQPDAPQA